jgi:aspartate--ammonia ligase
MGIRVNKESLLAQLKEAGCEERAKLPFHSALLEDRLPLSVGGGIGQSRICMVILEKIHIGQVQCSIWDAETVADCVRKGIRLL